MRFPRVLAALVVAGCGSPAAPAPDAAPRTVVLPPPAAEAWADSAPRATSSQPPDVAPARLDGPDVEAFNAAGELQIEARREEAMRAYGAFIMQYPDSPFVPNAFVALGDLLFEEGELALASESYSKALVLPNGEVANYARYKRGWCAYNLGERQRALADLVQLLRRNPKTALRTSAEKDLPHFFAGIGAPNKAWPLFEMTAGEARARELMLRLAEIYDDQGNAADAATVRADVARR